MTDRPGLEARLQADIDTWTRKDTAKIGGLKDFINKIHGALSSDVSRDDVVLSLQLSKSFADCERSLRKATSYDKE